MAGIGDLIVGVDDNDVDIYLPHLTPIIKIYSYVVYVTSQRDATSRSTGQLRSDYNV